MNVENFGYNDKEIRAFNDFRAFPLWFRGLMYVGFCRFCTAEQLFRWLLTQEPDERLCRKAVAHLVGTKLVSKIGKAILKKLDYEKDVLIFYALEAGYREVMKRSISPKLAEHPGAVLDRQFSWGVPKKQDIHRISHQLGLAESILDVLSVGYYFVWFKSEFQLRAEIQSWWARKKRAMIGQSAQHYFKPPSFNTGDYEIQLLVPESSQASTMTCEIVNKMTLKQIKQKPGRMKWYCMNERKARLIKDGTGRDAIILDRDSFFEPRRIRDEINAEFYQKGLGEEACNEILQLIEYFGGVVTAELLENYSLKKRNYFRDKLERLHERGHLQKIGSCLNPGESRGRDTNHYCLNHIDTEDFVSLRPYILNCWVLTVSVKRYEFQQFVDEAAGSLFLIKGKSILLAPENDYRSIQENINSFNYLNQKYEDVVIVIVTAKSDRSDLYKKHAPRFKVFLMYNTKNSSAK